LTGITSEIYFSKVEIEEIFLRCDTFQLPKKKSSVGLQEKFLIGWFGNIAEKVLENSILENNHFEKKHQVVPVYHDHLTDIRSFQQHEEEFEEEEKHKDALEAEKLLRLRILMKAMERLKPKEREILLEYKKIKAGSTNMSEDRIAYLCKRWKTNHLNLLQIKVRATKKLHRLFLDEQEKENKRTNTPYTRGTSL
jgi:hypothetical protein